MRQVKGCREGERERGREGEREGGREGGRERERERSSTYKQQRGRDHRLQGSKVRAGSY